MIRLGGVVEQIGVRLGRMETEIDAVEAKIEELYRWVMPSQITRNLFFSPLTLLLSNCKMIIGAL